jgi:predicted TIM-barrel fold metal-dependent hydrolase
VPTIDVHAHLYDRRYVAELDRLFEHAQTPLDRANKAQKDRFKGNSAAFAVEERVELMERAGLDYQVLSLSIPMSYEGDAPTRLRCAQISNDQFADTVARFPNRFLAFASLPLPDVQASLKELARCIDELRMVGVCLGSNIKGMRLDDAALTPIFDEIDRRGLTVFLHPAMPVCTGPDVEPYNANSALAYIFDTGVTVYRMIFSGMLERYRRLNVIVPHMGGMLPFMTGRIQGGYLAYPERRTIPRPPLEYLRELYYDTVIFHHPSLKLAHEMFGAERILLGSDYPLGSGSLEEAVTFVAESGFSQADREKMLGANAARVLGLAI